MDEPPIVDHVFRPVTARHSGSILGMCAWRGACNRPADDHITVPDYRARRDAE